jgi:ATP-binding cassette, subfamily F, member 3
LEEALKEFDGSAVVVSHDRYFLNQVADLLIVFEGPGRAQVVHGNYDTYERLRAEQLAAGSPNSSERSSRVARPESAKGVAEPSTPFGDSGRATQNSKPAKRKRKFPYRKVEELETEIASTEATVAKLESALADGDLYRDANKVRDTMQAFEDAKTRLQQLYEHWEEAVELN